MILLEDLQNIGAIGYNRLQKELFGNIIWIATEIQSKHKTLNNNEDQYNSLFQSLLKAKGYKTEPQTQRGESQTGKTYGELDIAIFAESGFPLSIFEAFSIKSIDKNYIINHIKKLSESYDPNGLQYNYAVIYAENKNFLKLWERYKQFLPQIDFTHKLVTPSVEDITNEFAQVAAIKIGLTNHNNRGYKIKVIHIFLDMYFY